ncbi:hypothetical protein GCM10027073_56420 [Streptomyces chlorus]|uniref:hypothetical protein n=1 Tax=Streptomyces chlorus TaxID=887452 RepID=UPI0036D3ACE3
MRYIRTARSRNSSGYFLGAGIVWAPFTKPIWPAVTQLRISGEAQVAPGLALVQAADLAGENRPGAAAAPAFAEAVALAKACVHRIR